MKFLTLLEQMNFIISLSDQNVWSIVAAKYASTAITMNRDDAAIVPTNAPDMNDRTAPAPKAARNRNTYLP